jgi:hypothetical protein
MSEVADDAGVTGLIADRVMEEEAVWDLFFLKKAFGLSV